MNIDFNKDFARAHEFMLKRHHWKHFRIYVGWGKQPHPGCEACLQVISRSEIPLEEVIHLVPEEGQERPRKHVNPSADGVKKGRPKKGQASDFNIWAFMEKERPNMYQKISADNEPPRVKCLLCKKCVDLVRVNNETFLKQHEESKCHQAAMSKADGTGIPCQGFLVREDAEDIADYLPAIKVWTAAGFPWINSGPVLHALKDEEGQTWIRSESCKKEAHNVQPGKSHCIRCEKWIKNKDFKQRVCRWGARILYVELLHATLVDAENVRAEIISKIADSPCFSGEMTGWEVSEANVDQLSYADLYTLCHQKMAHLQMNGCNAAGVSFVEGKFRWLLRKKVFFNKGPHSEALSKYARSLAEGASCQEMKIAEHVLSGKLRSDCVLKTLITAMVMKCTRNNQRRKNSNQLPGVSDTDLAETGFTLAACP